MVNVDGYALNTLKKYCLYILSISKVAYDGQGVVVEGKDHHLLYKP